MSLINVRNFITPFTNTTHLVTIILVTIVFALFRIQGGAVSIDFSQNRPTRATETAPVNSIDNIDSLLDTKNTNSGTAFTINKPSSSIPNKRIPDKGKVTLEADDVDLLNDMIGKEEKSKTRGSNTTGNADSKQKSGGLDDIEKIVGLR
jgi:hypothetical protein